MVTKEDLLKQIKYSNEQVQRHLGILEFCQAHMAALEKPKEMQVKSPSTEEQKGS